jgi:formamidopyrimidine-DNA glycosylase
MPELPEVETIRRGLEREAVGKRIKSVEVTGTRTVRRQTKKQLISRLEGTKI